MDSKLPERIEPFRFAEQGRSLAGSVPLAGMRRLAEVVHAPEGEARVELRFARDRQGRYKLEGQVAATLSLICQRCMQPVSWSAALNLDLLLVGSDAEAERIGPGEDALVVADEFIVPREIIEDELLLALPIIARHESGECRIPRDLQVQPDEVAEAPRNPFAVLAELKKDR